MDASSCGHEPTIQSISADVAELTTSINQQCTILSKLHTTVDKTPTSGAVKSVIESLEPTVTNTHHSLIAVTTDLSTTLTSVQDKHRYDARLESTKSDHQAQINDLKAGFEAQLKELRDINVKHEASLAIKTSEHKNALTDLRRTQDRLNTVRESVTELLEELSATVKRYDEAFESTRCSQRKALDASDQRYLKELEAQTTEHQEEVSLHLQSACADLEGELQSTKDCARRRLRTVSYIHGQDRDLALKTQKSDRDTALSSRDASYKCSLLSLKRNHSEAFQSQEATYHNEVHDLKISHQKALDSQSRDHQKALDSQSRDHQKALDAKDAEYTTALALQDSGRQSAMTLPQNPLDESECQTSSKEHELSLKAQDIIALQNDVKQLKASQAQETVTAQRGKKQQLVEAQAVQIRDLKQQLETLDGKIQNLSAQFDQFREQMLKMQTAQRQRPASQQPTGRQSGLPPSPSASASRMTRQASSNGPDDQHVLPEANVPGQLKVTPHMNKSGHSTGRAEERATTHDTVQGSPTSKGSPAVTNRSDRTMSPAAKRTLAITKAQQLRAMIYLAWDVTTAEEAEFKQSLNSLFSHRKLVDKVADGIDLYCRRAAKVSSGPCFRSAVVCVTAGKGGPTMTAANCPSCKKGKKLASLQDLHLVGTKTQTVWRPSSSTATPMCAGY